MRREIKAPVWLALVLLLAACSGAETRKARCIQKGEALMAKRDFAGAQLQFRNALQIDPGDTNAQTLGAAAAEQAGDYHKAARLYRAALNDPANVKARAALAKLYIFAGAPDEAEKLVDDGLAKEPAHPTLLAIRGATKLLHGDTAGARADGEAAIRAAPSDADAAALLASLHARLSEQDEAIALIERVSSINPRSIELRVILAQLYVSADRKEEAERQLQRVVQLDPLTLIHRYRLAQLQTVIGRVDSAEATLRDAIRVAPQDVDTKLALANLIASQRSFEAAERSFQGFLRDEDGNLMLKVALGRFYEAHNRYEKAKAIYRAVTAADRTGDAGLQAQNRLASLALQSNRAHEARAIIADILRATPQDTEALVMRANLALARGEASSAITDLRTVMREQPSSQPLMRALARCYLANGDQARAEESLHLAVQANPRDIDTRLALAKLLIDAGRPEQAQLMVSQLVADRPGDVRSLEAAFRVYMAGPDLGAARRTAVAIQALRPEEATGYYLAGLVEQADGKLDAARHALEKAVALEPEAVAPLSLLVRVDVAQDDPTRALRRINETIDRYPRNLFVRQLRAEILGLLNRWNEVVAVSIENINIAPRWWAPYRSRAKAEIALEKIDSALATYRTGIDATGGSPVLLTDLATIYERLGMPELAIAEYEAWVEREPHSDVIANNLAMLLVTHRAADSAARARALELSQRFETSNNAAFLDTYAWVRYARGEYNKAVPPLLRAVHLNQDVPSLRARLGLVQKAAGQRALARRNLEVALASEVPFSGIKEARAALAELKRGS